MLRHFVAYGVERGEAKTGLADTERNTILMLLLLVTFIAMSKGRRKVWPGKGKEDPDICAALEVDWARCDRTKNLKTMSVIH